MIFNTNPQAQTFAYKEAKQYHLHPVLQRSIDSVVKQSKADEGGFTVPALSTAIFVE